jgi:hypothetical protein
VARLPPPLIGTARLLEYAIVDRSIMFTGSQRLYVDGELLGRVPRLAICQEMSSGDTLLFRCDRNWNVLAVSGSGTAAQVKATAERAYEGLSKKWIASPYSEEQVQRYLNRQWGGQRCSFCGKWPWQIEKLFASQSGCICDNCVRSFHASLD